MKVSAPRQRTKAKPVVPESARSAPDRGKGFELNRSVNAQAHNTLPWRIEAEGVSLVRSPRRAKTCWLQARPQNIEIDLSRSALVVVDMQNDFCHREGWFGQKGVSMRATRKPIGILSRLLPLWRATAAAGGSRCQWACGWPACSRLFGQTNPRGGRSRFAYPPRPARCGSDRSRCFEDAPAASRFSPGAVSARGSLLLPRCAKATCCAPGH